MPDVGCVQPPVRVLDEIDKICVPASQNDIVDSMSPPHAAEYVSAQYALAQDCATLKLIDGDIEECRTRIARAHAQIRALERQRDAVQRRVSVHRARLSPLRAVPDQVLQEIFQRCLPDTPYIVPNTRSAPMVLTHVCRRWRAVAHGTSELWSSVTLHDRGIWNQERKLEMMKRWLDRSRMRPIRLSVTCPPHTDFGLGGDPLRSDVFRLAMAHCAQLSDLCLNVNRTYLRHFMDRARLHALRSLVISLHTVHRIDEPPEPTTPPLISAPHLKHIAFKGNGASIELVPRALFPQITHLSFDCAITLDLALLFEDFPNLAHLTLALSLSREALRFRQPLQGDHDHRIVSPSLRCLEVRLDKDTCCADSMGESTQLARVLGLLDLPALETLVIAAPRRPPSSSLARTGTGCRSSVATETRRGDDHHHDAWSRHPSVSSLLSRSRYAQPRCERRDLASSALLLRTEASWGI